MTDLEREELAKRANRVAREARYGGAPLLAADSDAETVAAWLQWCDPNGCHTADLARAEDCEPYDLESAWERLAAMVSDE